MGPDVVIKVPGILISYQQILPIHLQRTGLSTDFAHDMDRKCVQHGLIMEWHGEVEHQDDLLYQLSFSSKTRKSSANSSISFFIPKVLEAVHKHFQHTIYTHEALLIRLNVQPWMRKHSPGPAAATDHQRANQTAV